MLFAVLFFGVLCLTVFLAVKFGGRDERIAAAALVVATALTPLLLHHRYVSAELGVLGVDVALFAVLLAITLRSDRFWPIWAAGFQLCGVFVHLGAMIWNNMAPAAYAEMLGIWSHLVMYSLIGGVMLEARTRVE